MKNKKEKKKKKGDVKQEQQFAKTYEVLKKESFEALDTIVDQQVSKNFVPTPIKPLDLEIRRKKAESKEALEAIFKSVMRGAEVLRAEWERTQEEGK